jgi:hypothetical protein
MHFILSALAFLARSLSPWGRSLRGGGRPLRANRQTLELIAKARTLNPIAAASVMAARARHFRADYLTTAVGRVPGGAKMTAATSCDSAAAGRVRTIIARGSTECSAS